MDKHPDASFLQSLDGSWERARRSPTTAAFVGLLIVGVIYFYAQSILAGGLFAFGLLKEHAPVQGKTFIEQLTQTTRAMKNPVRYALIISQFGFMLVPTIWLIRRWHTVHVLSYIRLVRVSAVELLLAIAVTVCFVPVGEGIGEFLKNQLHIPDFLAQISAGIFTSYSRPELFWLIAVICVAPAICEELLFRGYVQRTLERTLGMKSVFITGIIFGLYHMQPLSLITLSLLGILIGYFSYRSKSLLPCIGAHFTNNFIAVLSLYKTADEQPVFGMFRASPGLLLIAGSIFAAGGMLYLYHRATEKNFSPAEPLPDNRAGEKERQTLAAEMAVSAAGGKEVKVNILPGRSGCAH